MASSTRTQVEQDMTKHTLGHIFAKLRGLHKTRTTFVVVEGSDDLAFYCRFFDRRVASMYYSTKLMDDGNIQKGGCEELQHIVSTVLADGRSDQIVGIMDTDYRRYLDGYEYPRNIFHTDHRDMEMTAISTMSVQQALRGWIAGYDNVMGRIENVLRHVGRLRMMNDLFRLGCNFSRMAKINCVFDTQRHQLFENWKMRYNKAFMMGCLKKRKQNLQGLFTTVIALCRMSCHLLVHSYKYENLFDLCHGHDTIKLLSLSLVNTATYSEEKIWAKCFDAYAIGDFKNSLLYAELHQWESRKGLSLFRRG